MRTAGLRRRVVLGAAAISGLAALYCQYLSGGGTTVTAFFGPRPAKNP